jgi:hypothetical protein
MLSGAAVYVGLPLLDCFLNGNGTALASGAPLPVRFGTWFWGLGMTPGLWQPKSTGKNFEYFGEISPLEPYKDYINVFSDWRVIADGRPNIPHVSGWAGLRTGAAPTSNNEIILAPTLDVLVADAIGGSTRFRSLEVAATGNGRDTFSARNSASYNLPEITPAGLYERVFGPGFVDPNAPDFKPDPRVMARQSVLSGVKDQRDDLLKNLGTEDRTRMDQYFTSLRQVEQQLDLMLQKPPPAAACHVVTKPEETRTSADVEIVSRNHELMVSLLAMAVACNQTRLFNVAYSGSTSLLHRAGDGSTHHQLTHEEAIDPKLGYQIRSTYFVNRSIQAMAHIAKVFASIREGDGTLLDRTLIMAHSDTDDAKTHAIESIPVITIGKAAGRLKTGYHLKGNGDPVTRVGLTLMNAVGAARANWGSGPMATTNPITEILA